MMKLRYIFTTVALAMMFIGTAEAQTLRISKDTKDTQFFLVSKDTAYVGYNEFTSIAVARNSDVTAQSENDWITPVLQSNGNISVFCKVNNDLNPRTGFITVATADGTHDHQVAVIQDGRGIRNQKIEVKTATDNQHNSNSESADKTIDGNNSTMYHSPYGTGTHFPVILTYTFKEASHVDYAVYTPRQDGNSNGNFQEVRVEYQLNGSSDWQVLKTMNFGGNSSAAYVSFGDDGIDNIIAVRFNILSGQNNFASCAEMAFYVKDSFFNNIVKSVFADNLCTQLKDGVTQEQINAIETSELRTLAQALFDNNYSQKYRVAEFRPYRPIWDLRSELKNSYAYNNHENPTGITFTAGEQVAIIVEGVGEDPISLQIRNFGPDVFAKSTYPLNNGVNIIKVQNKGNGYIDYYTSNYKTAPNVKIHFVNCTENGYFDLERGDTNEYWQELLANAKGDCLDILTEHCQIVFPVSALKKNCNDAVWLATTYDDIVKHEWELMGIYKYNRTFPNHQCVITVATSGGLYHASNDGFCVPVNALTQPTTSDPAKFDYWGAGHELGHQNQTTGLVWVGLTEVTNNIMSAYVEHMVRPNGYHRLENESNGFRYRNFYDMQVLAETYIPSDYIDSGKSDIRGSFLPSTNGDVFLTLIPFWQILCYSRIAGTMPDAYPDYYEAMRTDNNVNYMSDGEQQVNFMKTMCHILHLNLIDYFKKVRMFQAVDKDINDYSTRRLTITTTMLNNLKTEIETAGYPTPPEGLIFMNVHNAHIFADKAALVENTVGAGCSRSGSIVTITNSAWQNAVGFETYDKDGNLVAMTTSGSGNGSGAGTTTGVAWPLSQNNGYIMAVGYDGTRVICYDMRPSAAK